MQPTNIMRGWGSGMQGLGPFCLPESGISEFVL